MFKPLYRHCVSLILVFISGWSNVAATEAGNFFTLYSSQKNYDTPKITKSDILFDSLNLGKLGLGRRAYDYAMVGYNILKAKGKLTNDEILSIADLTLPSSKKRLFVIDVKNYKLLFVTYVAHGKRTGLDTALYFSNEPESNKTSVGFYTTLGTYKGSHGYSLRLEGHEIGFNSNALERDIVVHSATKYLGGHCDIIAGVVITRTKELGDQIKFYQNACGAILAPFDRVEL